MSYVIPFRVASFNQRIFFSSFDTTIPPSAPPIGFVEGMSCGSALFALDNNMYSDLGLKKNIHYVDYDGSIEGLIDKIKFYQRNNTQLEKIANNGYDFVINNFNSEKISLSFINFLNSVKIK